MDIMNIEDFINHIIKFDNIEEILTKCETQSKKGYIFERLYDIIIKFGFCDKFSNGNFNHLTGNSNNAKLKILENLDEYLKKKVLSGNTSGCSDITLQDKNDGTYIFISSKYPKSDDAIIKQKSVNYYDIQNIIAMATKNKDIYKKYKIYMVVPNKKKVLETVKKANISSKYITEHMIEENILDKEDLNKYFLAFKKDIIKNQKKDWNDIYITNKENLILRFHQELITQKTCKLIEEGNKSFLWGCKCRSGKTYMVGGIINKQFDIKNKLNVLIITPAPQFTNDLFNKFKNFDKFKIYHIEGSNKIQEIGTDDNNIFVTSKQLLQRYTNNKTIMKIKKLNLDIIAFDENHYSGTTDLSKNILDSYSSKNTVKIYLTATYSKPLQEWNIPLECQMYWDIEDEQICKNILINEDNITKLMAKHGNENVTQIIKYYNSMGFSINDIFKSYEKMPDLHIITNMFDRQRYEIIKENIMGSHYGFSFDVLFSMNKNKKFNYINEVKTILRYISGSIQFKLSLQSLLDRPKELLELISDCLKPKTIEKKIFGEVFTPMNFINNEMLKKIEEHWLKNTNENIWTNENLTWYDPATGMGNFPIAVYYKLMNGLQNKIPNEFERKKHIIEKQLYMGELNKKNCFVVKQIFNINNDFKLNLFEGNTLNINLNNVFGRTTFDIIIGNPPYNEELTRTGATPLYNKFIEYYVDKCTMLSFIVPSRWFAGGKGLDKFRKMMTNRTDILYIKHYDDACTIFGNTVDIKGGVNYFLIDKNYNGLCYYNNSYVKLNVFDIILDSKYYNIVSKLLKWKKLTDLYLGRYFGVESNDKRLSDNPTLIKCYVSHQKGFIKYIDGKEIKKDYNFYKIITTEAAFKGNSGFGNTFIGTNQEIHSGSYISFKVSNENEATSLLSYMKCKLPNFMLSLRKISQHISEETCKWIPLPPLNKEWNNEAVCEYFMLSDDDIKLINDTKICGYVDIKKI